jgi:hypothetical protein
MNLKLDRADLVLARNQTLGLEEALGSTVRCLRGAVWITQSGDYTDHYLRAGDGFRLDRPGLSLVYALEATEVLVSPPAKNLMSEARYGLRSALRRAMRATKDRIASTWGPEAVKPGRLRDWRGV